MEGHKKWMACDMLVIGIVILLARFYTAWDIWIVLGVLLVIKGVLVLFMPMCCKNKGEEKPAKKR